MMSSERWRLVLVTIAGFRGIAEKRRFGFDGKPGLICGCNGQGKSTVSLALQWALYGGFPPGVLQKASLHKFLSPVGGTSRAYAVEVVFERAGIQLWAKRDAATETFTLKVGKKTYEDEDAQQRLEAELGIDQDTFERTVLLQQSRVRSLLTDDLAERNKVLDRLLGMDATEDLKSVIAPAQKQFTEAAESWRDLIEREVESLQNRRQELQLELREAQATAKEAGYETNLFSLSGLNSVYEDLQARLRKVAKAHEVDLENLPSAKTARDASQIERRFAGHLSRIRKESKLHKRLADLERNYARLTGIYESLADAGNVLKERQQTAKALRAKYGTKAKLGEQSVAAEAKVDDLRKQIQTAGQLRDILVRARDYVQFSDCTECPVCERELTIPTELPSQLRKRIATLTTAEIKNLEAKLKTAEKETAAIRMRSEELEQAEEESREASEALRARQAELRKMLKASGDDGLLKSLKQQIAANEAELRTLRDDKCSFENELTTFADEERQVRETLVPVLALRDSLRKIEARIKETEVSHKDYDRKAKAMDASAVALKRITQALVEVKEQIAGSRLGRAKPRAVKLFRAMVRHPLFDHLNINTIPRAKKVDYSFEVAASGDAGSNRDARLVLSDGQLTATALALFFALAESANHQLDLLYIDDPTQNLDPPHKEWMAEAVADVATRRQLIVTTQDDEFVEYLRNAGFLEKAAAHRLTSWDGTPELEAV